MDTNNEVSGPVELARIQANESLLSLSTKSGIPRNTLRRKIANPELLTLAETTNLANALRVTPIDLFSRILRFLSW